MKKLPSLEIEMPSVRERTWMVGWPNGDDTGARRDLISAKGVASDGTEGDFTQIAVHVPGKRRLRVLAYAPGKPRYLASQVEVTNDGKEVSVNLQQKSRWVRIGDVL